MIERAGEDEPRRGLSVERRAWWIFVSLLLLAAALAAAWLAIGYGRYTTYELRIHEAVSGLIEDAPVEFHGVDVGRVERVRLTGPESVSVLLRVRKDAPVTSATVATITSRGLASKGFTGYVYVALEDDGSRPQTIADAAAGGYRVLRSGPARSINVDTAINQVNQNVLAMTLLMQSALDARTLASLRESLDSVHAVARSLEANSRRIDAILANAERATARLGPLLDRGGRAAATLQDQVLPKAYDAMAGLDRLSASVDASAQRASSQLEPLLESSRDTARALQTQLLPQAYEAMSNLNRLSTSLQDATARIERDPSVLVRGSAARPGPGETR
jgi:phospholipid/cholesterol/gamma-HCH transport system substrate-binding protein